MEEGPLCSAKDVVEAFSNAPVSHPPTWRVRNATWRAAALLQDAEVCRGRRTGIMNTKSLFKAHCLSGLGPSFFI